MEKVEKPILEYGVAKPPANFISVAHDTVHNIALKAINLFLAPKLTGAIADNFTRFEITVKVQVGYTSLSLAGKNIADRLPQFILIIAIFNLRLVGITIIRHTLKVGTHICTQCIHNRTV